MKIYLNGMTRETDKTTLTYEEIAVMAGCKPEYNPTVTFATPKGCPQRYGCPRHGQTVVLCEGIILDCVYTGSA
jgi:hypothetical protein